MLFLIYIQLFVCMIFKENTGEISFFFLEWVLKKKNVEKSYKI